MACLLGGMGQECEEVGTEVAVLKARLTQSDPHLEIELGLAQSDPHLLVEIELEGHLGLKAGLAQEQELGQEQQSPTTLVL